MKIFTFLNNLLKQIINTHKHIWKLKCEHHARDYSYKQEHYYCKCGHDKFVLRQWNKSFPEIKIVKNENK